MRMLLRLRAILIVAVKRLLAQPLLSAAMAIGFTVAVALLLTVPIYAESVAFRMLENRLTERSNVTSHPPFSIIIQYIGSWHEPVTWEDTLPLHEYITTQAEEDLELGIPQIIRHIETDNLRLYPANTESYEENRLIDYVSFATTEQIEQHVEIVEGVFPPPAEPGSNSIIDVMITEDFASEIGIQIGETYQAYDWRLDQNDSQQVTMVRIAGIWRALDEDEAFWFYRPNVFKDLLIVSQDTFINRINPYRETSVNLGLWYLISDGGGVTTSHVDDLLLNHENVSLKIDQLLPGTAFGKSPVRELRSYQYSVRILTVLLAAFSIPIFVLLILFIVMVIGLSVEKRGIETAVHRSRGTSPFQVIGLAVVEGFILGVLALLAGSVVALLLTRLMGSVHSFMDFSGSAALRVSVPPLIVVAVGAALFLSVIIYIIPTLSASRHTIISVGQARARAQQRPAWQRLGLDILLLLLVSYFYYQLVQQGGLFIDHNGESALLEDALADPLLYLLPPATIFVLALLVLRVLPLIMRFISWILQLTDNVGLLIVTRKLERSPQSYYLPLLLLICTVGLGIYMASFAHTVDRYLYEQQFYRVAADIEVRVFKRAQASFLVSNNDEAQANIHISEFNDMDQIENATRLGEYSARAQVGNQRLDGRFIGVDRSDFGRTGFWRFDFAGYRLGYLMNALASQNDTVLVSRDLIENTSLEEGDLIRVEVSAGSDTIPLEMTVVGVLDYFPRWFPEEHGALFVGNLDYLFEQAGVELAHRIIARTPDNFDQKALLEAIYDVGADGVSIRGPAERIERIQSQPERQGLFGILSIGFIASLLVTVLGLFLYTLFSYQRRMVELGILRAVGLSRAAMMVSVAWELGLLIVSGLGLGIGLGMVVSGLYIPYLQFSTDRYALVPPYVVEIAWAEIAQVSVMFLLTFVVMLVVLLVVLGRMRIFEAVKLGESV